MKREIRLLSCSDHKEMYKKVWCTCNSVVLLIKPVCLLSFCFVVVAVVVFWRSSCRSRRQILRTLLPTPPHQAAWQAHLSRNCWLFWEWRGVFSRLDFRRPLSPVFDLARDGSDSRTAAGYRAYNLGENKMEQQTTITTPPSPSPQPIKDETVRRA